MIWDVKILHYDLYSWRNAKFQLENIGNEDVNFFCPYWQKSSKFIYEPLKISIIYQKRPTNLWFFNRFLAICLVLNLNNSWNIHQNSFYQSEVLAFFLTIWFNSLILNSILCWIRRKHSVLHVWQWYWMFKRYLLKLS